MSKHSKTIYQTDIVIGGKVNRSLSGAVSTAVGLLGKLTGNSQLSGFASNVSAVSKLSVGLGAAGVVVSGVAKGVEAATNYAKEAIEAAKEYESAMADVAKVVDGLTDDMGKHTQAYVNMSKEILGLSTKIPMTATEIAKIIEQAGQANIESDQLVRFAGSAAKMGIAFDTTAEQSGQWMAVWRTSMNLTQDEVETLADQINYLGNTSSENALKISEVVTDVGSLGKIAGLSSAEVAALAAATTGVEASVAGTGIKNMIVALSSGTAATKKQKAAFDKLGISATKLSVRMQKDAQGAILDVLKAINKLPGSQQTAVIKDIFGKTSLETVAKLAGNVENLQEQLDKINDPVLYAGSMEKEFAARSATYENQLQLWENTKERFKIEVGTSLLEKLNDVMPELTDKLSVAFEQASPRIQDAIDQIDTEALTKLVESVIDMIPLVVDFVSDTLPSAVTTIGDIAKGMKSILDYINNSLTSANNLLATLKAIKEFLKTGKLSNGTMAEMVMGMYKQQKSRENSRSQRNASAAAQQAEGATQSSGASTMQERVRQAENLPATPFADGGIVTRTTFAMIGEGGESEAVIPLSKLSAMLPSGVHNESRAETYTFSPTINITSDNPQAVRQAVDDGMNEAYEQFKWLMRKYQHDEDRVRF